MFQLLTAGDTQTQKSSKKELQNKHLPKGARSKSSADCICISGACSNF